MRQTRRDFLACSAALAAGAIAHLQAQEGRAYRAAIAGRTGGGDYGHGFDTIFADAPNVSVEAIADVNERGLVAAAKRSGAKRSYRDYREMFAKEKPELAVIAPRHPDCHHPIAMAALEAGAHLMIEKPFTEHLNEADEIVSAARKKNRKILVGHKNRFTAEFQRMQRQIREGFLGTVLEMRVQGKQDARAGGEDLIVLGTHDFDTMRFFFGNPISCVASVFMDGRPATKADVRKGREPMLVLGNTIRASYHFRNNILCTWQSVTAEKEWNTIPRGKERWGFTIFGTRRILSYYSGSTALYLDTPFLGHKSGSGEWKALPDPRDWPAPPHETSLARNLIHAIEKDTEPSCNGEDGRWTIEMVAAVYESHRTGRPVEFPLKERTNPLLRL